MLIKSKLNVLKKTTVNVEGKEKEILWYPDHAKPTTRRDFIRAGLIEGAALFALPTIFDLLAPKEVFAADESEHFSFNFYYSGGSDWMKQALASRDQNGSLPADFDYTMAGVATNTLTDSTPTSDHGAEMRRSSFFYGQLVSLMGAGPAKEIFAIAAHPAGVNDDNPNNKCGSTPLLAAAGRRMSPAPKLVESTPTVVSNAGEINESYVDTLAIPFSASGNNPLAMTADNSVKIAATPLLALNPSQMSTLFNNMRTLNERHAARLAAANSSLATVSSNVAGGAGKLESNRKMSETLNLDPAMWLPQEVIDILDNAANFPTGAGEARKLKHLLTSMVARVCRRVGAVQFGGADHHDGSNVFDPNGSSAKFQIASASAIAAVVKTARFLGVNAAITCVTNGNMTSTRANGGGYNPTGDAGQYSVWALFGRRASGYKPQIAKAGRLGYVGSDGQSSNLSKVPTPEAAAAALLVNHLEAIYPGKGQELTVSMVNSNVIGNIRIEQDWKLIS